MGSVVNMTLAVFTSKNIFLVLNLGCVDLGALVNV